MTQYELPLGNPAGGVDQQFLVSPSNQQAFQQLERWGAWPVMAALLVGPRKSGRSLLARDFASKSGGTMADDAERADEAALFHAWNAAQAARRPLLLVAEAAPPEWRIRLPDLRSRLMATPVLRIGPPDDALIEALLWRQFGRRAVAVAPDLVAWLVRRIERSHLAIDRVADTLEAAAMHRHKRALSIPAARAVLAAAGLLVDSSPDQERDTQ